MVRVRDSNTALRAWAGLALAAAILVGFRLHAFSLPLETDECNYAYIGKRLLLGDRLYLDAWDHQPFGVFALFAGVIALFGDAPHVFRWMATAFCLASLAILMAMLRRLCGMRTAMIGGFLYALTSSDPGTGGEGCNREIYMNTLILAAWFLLIPNARSRSKRDLSGLNVFLSGLALALASTLKTVVAVHWVLLAAWLAWVTWRRHEPKVTVREIGKVLGCFVAAPLLVWLGAYAYFAGTGRAAEFTDAVFLFNVGYSHSAEPMGMRFLRFFSPLRHPLVFESALPLWLVAAAAGVFLVIRSARKRDENGLLIFLFLLAGYGAVCLPGRFWPHYYHLLIPPAVLAAAILCETVANSLTRPLGVDSGGKRWLGHALCLLIPIAVALSETKHYLSQPPLGITIKRYNTRDFWARAQGQNVASVTDPDDSIFVFGNDASIYYYAHRRCASRYTMITGLSAGMHGAEHRREVLMDELRRSPPRLIVVLFDEEPFEEWKAFLREFYGEPVGWDFHDERPDKAIMFVLARKDRPIEPLDWNWDRSRIAR